MTAMLGNSPKKAADPLKAIGAVLAEKLAAAGPSARPDVVSRALHELLDGQDDASRALRVSVQIHLARVSNAPGRPAATSKKDMLSTEEAAGLMDCSRPYVAMLIDAGTLAGGVKSQGGHRKVPRASVTQWIAANKKALGADKNYRKAATKAGMYLIAEETYLRAAKKGAASAR